MSTLIEVINKPANERTLEDRILLLEKEIERLDRENFTLRVSLDGSMSLCRQVEKCFIDSDKRLSWCYKVISQNYSLFTGN